MAQRSRKISRKAIRKAKQPSRRQARPDASGRPEKTGRLVPLGRALLVTAAVLVLAPPGLVAAYRVVPPPLTMLMVERLAEGEGLHKQWRPLSEISPDLVRSVIAGEDSGFCRHHGFDFAAMRAAAAHNARNPGKVRGGSTLSQQTAKNVFLWPQRSYLRKGLEAGFTTLIEGMWGKRRIMEVYLNVVEWGPGVYGAQAASRRYFAHDADALTPLEAARLAAILPDPLRWKAVRPGGYVQGRSRRIDAGAKTVRADDLAACVLRDD